MKVLRNILILLLTLPMVCSCIYDYPEPNFGGTHLELTFIKDSADVELYPGMSDLNSEKYDIRYVIKAFRRLSNGDFSQDTNTEFIFTKDDINSLDSTVVVSLEEGNYRFITFADFVPHGTNDDYHYNTNDFSNLYLQFNEYQGNTDTKRIYVGSQEINVIRYGSILPIVSDTIRLSPVLTKYHIIATDVKGFMKRLGSIPYKTKSTDNDYIINDGEKIDTDTLGINLEDYFLKITYHPEMLLTNMNLHYDNMPIDGKNGIYYMSKIKRLNENEALLGFDSILLSDRHEAVKVRVSVYDKDSLHITTVPIEIPVKKGSTNIHKGDFLTHIGFEDPDAEGIVINSDYDGSITIVVD